MSNKKVTKYDLVNEIYKKNDIEKKDIQVVVDALLSELKIALLDEATIELRGFGTFELCLRNGRKFARNPKTGEQVSVKPHYVAKFRSGQELRKTLLAKNPKNEK